MFSTSILDGRQDETKNYSLSLTFYTINQFRNRLFKGCSQELTHFALASEQVSFGQSTTPSAPPPPPPNEATADFGGLAW